MRFFFLFTSSKTRRYSDNRTKVSSQRIRKQKSKEMRTNPLKFIASQCIWTALNKYDWAALCLTIIRPWLKLTNPMQRLAIASKWKPEALFSLSDWCYMIENSDKNNDDVWQIFQCRKQMCKKAYKRSIEIGLLLNYKCIFVYIYIYTFGSCAALWLANSPNSVLFEVHKYIRYGFFLCFSQRDYISLQIYHQYIE